MTPATLDYLLRLAIEDRDKHARTVIKDGTLDSCAAWGDATIAVRELLTLRQRAV